MALSMSSTGPDPTDPRSTQGMLARGANIYMGASKSPYAGQVTTNSMETMQQAKLLPQYKKQSLADVARMFLNGAQ